MDRHQHILDTISGLDKRLDEAGFADWLRRQQRIEVDGQSYVLLGGDRLASEAEAKIHFALDHRLIAPGQVRSADASQPLSGDLTTIDVKSPEGEE